ncbi:MAG: hypothetical protein HY903_08300 [Deltaproteobacteria bacterium]|nr:hypothetical protein [Deltaproteobacteria bacterium]
MRTSVAPVILCVVTALVACREDKLTRHAPRLDMTVYATGQAYDGFDDATLSIALGEVPVYATKWAIFQMSNPTQIPLKIGGVRFTASVGQRWQEAHWLSYEGVAATDRERPFSSPAAGKKLYDCNLEHRTCALAAPACPDDQVPAMVNGCDTACIDAKECITEVPAFGVYLLGIAYQPLEEGEHMLQAEVHSNAANAVNGAPMTLSVTATAVFNGAPDVEIHYNNYAGPMVEDCSGGACVIPAANAMSFGNIGLTAVGTAPLTIRNTALCQPFIGVDACTLCALTVDKDGAAFDLGIGFKPGTNDDGRFYFGSSTRVPFDILQRNLDCADAINPNRRAEGAVTIPVNFQAPDVEGEYHTTLVVESTDPDEPVIEIPVVAYSRNAPVAIARFREFDPLNPGAPYTDPTDIQPLRRVNFDGRQSYDPRDPTDPGLITSYTWTVVEYPIGTNPLDFQHQGVDTPLYSFWLPLAGHYVVALKVANTDGIESGDTVDSRVEFEVIPGSRIHIQLTWDDSTNDQDLHLMYLPQSSNVCEEPWDCYFANKEPVWLNTAPAGAGPNPRLDIDDTNGLGPENINIDAPVAASYRIAIHYWRGTQPTRNTVRVYLNGIQVAEYRRTLTDAQAWLVADIKWNDSGIGSIEPYAADVAGQVGAIIPFSTSDCSGFGL